MNFILILSFLYLPNYSSVFEDFNSEADTLFKKRKYSDAKIICENNLKQNPNDAEALALLSQIYLKPKYFNLDKSVELIEKAISIKPNNSDYYLVKALVWGVKISKEGIFALIKNGSEIKETIFKAYEINPKNIQACNAIFYFYLLTPKLVGGDPEEAFKIAKNVKSFDEYNGNILLGIYFQKLNDEKKAMDNFQNAISISPEKPNAYRSLGSLFEKKKKYSDAIEQYSKFVKYDSENPDAYTQLAKAQRENNQFVESILNYKKALSIENDYPFAIYGLAQTYEASNEILKSIETYQWFLKNEKTGKFADEAKDKIKKLKNNKSDYGSH